MSYINAFVYSVFSTSAKKVAPIHDQTCYQNAETKNQYPISIAIFNSNNERLIPTLEHTNVFYQWDRDMVEPAVEDALIDVNENFKNQNSSNNFDLFVFCKTGDGYFDDQCSQQVGPDVAVNLHYADCQEPSLPVPEIYG